MTSEIKDRLVYKEHFWTARAKERKPYLKKPKGVRCRQRISLSLPQTDKRITPRETYTGKRARSGQLGTSCLPGVMCLTDSQLSRWAHPSGNQDSNPAGENSFWPHLWAAQLLGDCPVTKILQFGKVCPRLCPPLIISSSGQCGLAHPLTCLRDFSCKNILVTCLRMIFVSDQRTHCQPGQSDYSIVLLCLLPHWVKQLM